MQGIISLLDPQSEQMVKDIWQVIASNFGIDPARNSLVPHLSWHVAEEYPYEVLHREIQDYSNRMKPFNIQITGFGIFRLPTVVLYLSIAVSPRLLALQESIYNLAFPKCNNPNRCYQPGDWVPHITLVYRDLSLEKMGAVIQSIKPFEIEREVQINNFAVFCPSSSGEMEICPSYFHETGDVDGK